MPFNISLLHYIVTLPYPLLVVLPNGYKVKVTQIGNVTLSPEISLKKVRYVPSFKYNLISIHNMTIHSNCIVSFTKSSCFMQDSLMKRPLVIGRAEDGLYLLCPKCLQSSTHSNNLVSCSSLPLCKSCTDKCSSHALTSPFPLTKQE